MSPIERNAKDFWTGVVYIAIGAAAIFIGRDYGMGTAMKMGPAYFPVILSGLLILIGAVVPLLLILLATILSVFAGEGGTWGKSLVGFAIFVGIGLLLIFSWYFANRE